MTNELTNLIADVKEQVAYLKELGVETLSADLPELSLTPAVEPPVAIPTNKSSEPVRKLEAQPRPPLTTASRLNSLPSLARRTASPTMKNEDRTIPVTNSPPAKADSAVTETIFGEIADLPGSSETMEQIWADIGNCTRCPLHEGRTQVVHTVGNYQSDLMFIGEAPGADEDAKGEPFVGRAGQLLNKIIEAIGMKREEVCIGNINRCRPPGNRQPTLPEAHTCKPFLLREIAVIRPKVIVVMGNTALHNLLDTKVGITRMRGQFHDFFGVKVMPTFHPAYLLRDPSKKREVWDDMKKVREYLVSVGSA
ncbi:MAG: uracil-DNA glycosylase [Acidobacteriota bacterium]